MNMAHLTNLCISTIIWLILTTSAYSQDKNSCVKVWSEDIYDMKRPCSGTLILVNGEIKILTCAHMNGETELKNSIWWIQLPDGTNKACAFEKTDKHKDLTLLSVFDTKNLKAFKIASSESNADAICWKAGYPMGAQQIYRVCKYKNPQEYKYKRLSSIIKNTFVCDCEIGESGCAIINQNNEVVGVQTHMNNEKNAADCVSVKDIKLFLGIK